jgi:Meiotically up-regulated gene 113
MGQLALLEAPAASTLGFVYYATDFCNVKIGRTVSPRRRGGELKVTMLLTFQGGEQVERRHHRMWAKYRIGNSEWFRPSDDLLLWLAAQLLEGGRTQEAKALQYLVRGVKSRAA